MPESQNQIEKVTEMVKSVPEFMDAVSDVLQSPYGWIVLVGMVAWFLINKDLSNIFGLFERGEKLRLEKLEAYVSNESSADSDALKVIKDLRDAHYFKVATGIYAEKRLRSSLIKLHEDTSYSINWTHIKRALPFITTEKDLNSSIRDMKPMEKIGHYYNLFVGCLFLLLSAASILVFFVSKPQTLSDVFIGTTSALVCAFFAMFVFSQNWPYNSANKIKKELINISRNVEPIVD